MATIILGHSNFYIIECCRFIGVFLLLFGAFALEGAVERLRGRLGVIGCERQ